MPDQPTIAFCITCKNRTQHLEQTLALNILNNLDYPALKFVVLDYGSQDHSYEFLAANFMRARSVAIYSYRYNGAFRMAHAKNMAHRLGIMEGADILVNLDADNITGPSFARYIASMFNGNDKMFLWARMIKGELPRGISGRIAVTRKAFLLSGGYDEKYETWGADDKHFNGRLQRLGFKPVEIHRQYLLGVRHNDKVRFKEYEHAATQTAEDDFDLSACEDTISNFGKVGCGTVYRNFNFASPIMLNPVATRIFGIGLHKTATTSLHTALGILGFDSAHWNDAHWAKAIYQEVTQSGRSKTLERHYCLTDLPIPLLYRELDQTYPGSKFILTIRDEQDWLNSVRNHWSFKRNRFRSAWDIDPFTNKIHRAIYGQTTFDGDIFLARYRKHNNDVQEYFKDRPDDLLVMNMDNNQNWLDLCAFLGCAMPNEKYPQRCVTI